MPRVAAILGLFVTMLVLFSGGGLVRVSAQNHEPAPVPVAKKFDEFGKVGHCDLGARLDNFAILVSDAREIQASVVVYGPDGEGPGSASYYLKILEDYLVNMRGLDPKRVNAIYGGRNENLHLPKVELWTVPQGASPPEPQKNDTKIENFQGLFVEEQANDDVRMQYEDEMGPGIGGTTDASFADMLQQQKEAVGYVVVYSGEDLAPGGWRRVAQDQIDNLKSSFNVDASRLKMIFGGHQKESKLQLWILPKSAPPPVPDAGPELPPTKVVKVGDFYSLDDERNQKALFTRLLEILRQEKSVRAFLAVRLEQPNPEEEPSEAGVTEVVSPPEPLDIEAPSEPVVEIEPVDLTKLVEKWRVELTTTHKIAADRLTIVFTPAPEFHGSYLRLWIVPKGQPLPDPNEDEQEATTVQEEPKKDPKKDP